jgi:hypothetical protein
VGGLLDHPAVSYFSLSVDVRLASRGRLVEWRARLVE